MPIKYDLRFRGRKCRAVGKLRDSSTLIEFSNGEVETVKEFLPDREPKFYAEVIGLGSKYSDYRKVKPGAYEPGDLVVDTYSKSYHIVRVIRCNIPEKDLEAHLVGNESPLIGPCIALFTRTSEEDNHEDS